MKIWANCIVNNEENFIWFAIMSIVDHVDKVIVWDTGSTDKTVEIIKEIIRIQGNKIDFKEVGEVDKNEFTKMRQKMLEDSKCDWILILDGDEIWWNNSIEKLVNEIQTKADKIEGIVVPMVMSVGDIYHIQEEVAGRYKLLGKTGHFSLKVLSRKIPGLHVGLPYGKESFFDEDDQLIQQRKDIVFLDAPYLHVTHLKRSSVKRKFDKFKIELGNSIDKDFQFPEVFYKNYPQIISSPWIKISGIELIKAKILTPARKAKRRFL